MSVSFLRLWKFSAIIFSSKLFVLLSLSPLSLSLLLLGIPIMWMLLYLKILLHSLTKSLFLLLFFFFVVQLDCFLLPCPPDHWHSSASSNLLLIPSSVFFFFSYWIFHFWLVLFNIFYLFVESVTEILPLFVKSSIFMTTSLNYLASIVLIFISLHSSAVHYMHSLRLGHTPLSPHFSLTLCVCFYVLRMDHKL